MQQQQPTNNNRTTNEIQNTKKKSKKLKETIFKSKCSFDDPKNETDVGDMLQIINSGRKISKNKSFVIDKMIQKNVIAAAIQREVADRDALLKLQQIERELLRENKTRVKVNQVNNSSAAAAQQQQ